MDKQQQFIAVVQTAFLANAINIRLGADAKDRHHEFSATRALTFMDDAIRASQMIAADMSAYEAADDFAGWMLESLREEGDEVPHWFAQ